MRRQVECRHPALLPHPVIIHDAMILTTIASCSMQKQNVLTAFARLLIKDFAFAPSWASDIHVATNDVISFAFRLLVRRCRSVLGIMKKFENPSPDVAVLKG